MAVVGVAEWPWSPTDPCLSPLARRALLTRGLRSTSARATAPLIRAKQPAFPYGVVQSGSKCSQSVSDSAFAGTWRWAMLAGRQS